jgi:hypothetical protein
MKIGCLILSISNETDKNFKGDDFFTPNAVNSFKIYHPDVDLLFVNNSTLGEYLHELGITEYYDHLGIFRIHLIKEFMKQKHYDKIIMLGADTFTCARLDEFINNTTDDLICSAGPPYSFMKTDYWSPQIENFHYNGITYQDVSFINADVTCFNSLKGAETVYENSIKYWTTQAEQGGLNYCYINQEKLNLKVSIVDFPYITSNSLYNVRSKGQACGGNQMYKGKLYNGDYKDSTSTPIGDIYPTSEYYVKDNKLFTKDNKQIKVFHYAEALGVKTKEEYNETLNEIKNMWFNEETKQFLIKKCNCKF